MIAEYLPQIRLAEMIDLHEAMFSISSQQTDITQFNVTAKMLTSTIQSN